MIPWILVTLVIGGAGALGWVLRSRERETRKEYEAKVEAIGRNLDGLVKDNENETGAAEALYDIDRAIGKAETQDEKIRVRRRFVSAVYHGL